MECYRKVKNPHPENRGNAAPEIKAVVRACSTATRMKLRKMPQAQGPELQVYGLNDQVQRFGTGFDGVGDEAAVEGGELAAVRACQCQQITVGYLKGTEKTGWNEFCAVEDADVIGPKDMARQGEEFGEYLGNGRGIAGRIRIALVAQDT